MSAPRIYISISAICAELARTGIAKAQFNTKDNYSYRGIDDVMARIAPLLAKYRVCILPRVLERTSVERRGIGSALLIGVTVRTAFDFVSARDGSIHTVEVYAEALDSGDKATSKAISAAFKQAVLQSFCIPVDGCEDVEANTHRLQTSDDQHDPDQGWDQWAADICEMIRVCETTDALDRVQNQYGKQFRALSKRRPDVFSAIGEAMQARRGAVVRSVPFPSQLAEPIGVSGKDPQAAQVVNA